MNQGTQFPLVQIPNDHDALIARLRDLIAGGLLKIKQIGSLAPGQKRAGSIHDEGFSQPALDAFLCLRKSLAQITAGEPISRAALHGIQKVRHDKDIGVEVANMFRLIGFGCGHRIADHPAHAIRKPPFKANIDREACKNRHCHGWEQCHGRKCTRQPKVEP